MLKSVCFISRRAVENHLKPTPDIAIISIKDPDGKPVRLPRGVSSTRLEFHDLYEEALNLPVGAFPDAITPPLAVFHANFILPDTHHAWQIIRFIRLQAEKPNPIDLIVHCEAGISRSAAVAMFVADRYAVPIDQANPDTSCANKRLLRLLNKIDDLYPPYDQSQSASSWP